MANTPWAILLCKFADDQSEPYPRQRFEELFTTVGSGKFNMVDFFRDMSHGQIDLTSSQVFPSINSGNLWYNLAQKRSDYTGSGANQAGRNALLAWGRNAVANEISGFFKFVVVTSVPADLFGGLGGVAADDGRWPNGMSSLSPSLIGQEMGHGYGLTRVSMAQQLTIWTLGTS